MADGTQTVHNSAASAGRATSKLALLAAFIAGAFAAWIVISFNTEHEPVAEVAPVTITQPANRPAPSNSGAGSQTSKPGVPKPNTKPGS